jgi:hypothetical protein
MSSPTICTSSYVTGANDCEVRKHSQRQAGSHNRVELVELKAQPGKRDPDQRRLSCRACERVANAVGVDTHSACVSLRFADGVSEVLAGRSGWRAVTAMEPGDVIVVDSGAGGGAPPAVPVLTTVPSPGVATYRTRAGGVNPCGPAEGEPLPEEEQNSKRLNMLFLSGPAEVRKALQQVCVCALPSDPCPVPCRTV